MISVAHRLTTLEMKELNERQRADHASRMYEQQKTLFRQLEDRNFELERKFAEVDTASLCCVASVVAQSIVLYRTCTGQPAVWGFVSLGLTHCDRVFVF